MTVKDRVAIAFLVACILIAIVTYSQPEQVRVDGFLAMLGAWAIGIAFLAAACGEKEERNE